MIETILAILFGIALPVPFWLLGVHLMTLTAPKYRIAVYVSILPVWIATTILALQNQNQIIQGHFESSMITLIIGVIVLVLAFVIDNAVMRQLGFKKLILITQLKQETSSKELVVNGIYNHARHPRYISIPLWYVGFGLLFGYPVFLWFSLYLFLTLWIASFLEDMELLERFGDSYKQYKMRVPAFFIHLWR